MSAWRVPAVAFVLVAVGCSHAQQAANAAITPQASATALQTNSATTPQIAVSSAPQTAAASAAAPLVRATEGRHRVIASTTKKPHATSVPVAIASEIYSVSASPSVVHDGQSVVWDVRTTPDIVSVAATTTMISLPLTRFSPGHFGLTFSVPRGVPGFFHGTYNMDVTATAAGGVTLHRGIALTFL